MATPVTIPLLNPNEPEAYLAALHVSEGQRVAKDEPICTLETTKSTADVLADEEGFISALGFEQGQTVRAGDVLCYLAESPGWAPPEKQGSAAGEAASPPGLPDGLRITRPALALARSAGLDLAQLPTGPLVTEGIVRQWIEKAEAKPQFSVPSTSFDPTAILIYGGGGHGKMVLDVLRTMGVYRVAGIIDDGRQPGDRVMGVAVLGGAGILPELYAGGVRLAVNAVGGIGNIAVRIKIFNRLAEAGFVFPVIIHSTASVDPTAELAPGAQVFTHAYVGSEARVGFGCIVNTGVIVSHDCVLGSYVNLSPGAILAGEVTVGDGALVGMGVTVNLGVKIGAGARIGNGATVKASVPEGGVVRAGTIWPS
ncbi:MAG: hypothetical protein EHM70_24850 [Chloroflexota bacterium]|nr:MAG: hypothetical protein EHM70_24850 [Chloroflexota bacterium]